MRVTDDAGAGVFVLAANALLERAAQSRDIERASAGGAAHHRECATSGDGLVFRNAARGPVWRTVALSGAPREAPPSMQAGYTIDKRVYRMDGSLADLGSIRQGDRVVVVLSGQPEGARNYPTVLVDLLPAGLEIETLLSPSDGAGATSYECSIRNGPFSWIGEITYTQVQESRDDRFVARPICAGNIATPTLRAR